MPKIKPYKFLYCPRCEERTQCLSPGHRMLICEKCEILIVTTYAMMDDKRGCLVFEGVYHPPLKKDKE